MALRATTAGNFIQVPTGHAPTAKGFTVTFWYNLASGATSVGLFSTQNPPTTAGTDGFGFFYDNASTNLQWAYISGGAGSSVCQTSVATPTGRWIHLAALVRPNGSAPVLEIWMNGVKAATLTAALALPADGPATWGEAGGSIAVGMNGSMAYGRFYRKPLSQGEIVQDMRSIRVPANLSGACTIDLPMTGIGVADTVNRVAQGSKATITGTLTPAAGPPVDGWRNGAKPPWIGATVNPDLVFPPVARKTRPSMKRAGKAPSPTPAQAAAPVAPNYFNLNDQPRLRPGWLRRGRIVTPLGAHATPIRLVGHRWNVRPSLIRRGRSVSPVPPQFNPPINPRVGQHRVWPTLLRRGRRAEIPPAQQAAPTNPPYSTVGQQHRIWAGWRRRGAAPAPIPPQFNPPYPVSNAHPFRLRTGWVRRGRVSFPLESHSTPPRSPVRKPFGRVPLVRRGRNASFPPAQVVVAPPKLPLKASSPRRLAGWLFRRSRRAEQGWPQATQTFDPVVVGGKTTFGAYATRTDAPSIKTETSLSPSLDSYTVIVQDVEYDHFTDPGGTTT